MTKKPETRLQQRIQKAVADKYGGLCYLRKIYTGPFQPAGMPDLLLCLDSLFIALEVKMPGEEPSKIQWKNIRDIRKAGGYATYVTTVKEALDAVEEAIRLSAERRRLRIDEAGVMSVLRSRDR